LKLPWVLVAKAHGWRSFAGFLGVLAPTQQPTLLMDKGKLTECLLRLGPRWAYKLKQHPEN